MKYFSCEGRFSRLYTYHIQLLMHFTRVKMLNIPYYLFQSIDKMAFIVQKREYEHQMSSLFHHSLIKIIVLHHLDDLKIAWEIFISNEIFTVPPIENDQYAPSSSHPSTSIPPSHPIVHGSSSDQSPSYISPPSSPSHIETGSPSRVEISEPQKTKWVEIEPLAKTYQRGHRKVFAPHIVGGTLPSISTKQAKKGKKKMTEANIEAEIRHRRRTSMRQNNIFILLT